MITESQSRTSSKQRSARTRTTRAAILAAAGQLAAEHGITSTTMDEVAKLAGVAKGSLYYNFASKDAIFSDILTTGLTNLGNQIKEAAECSSDPIEQLSAMIFRMISAIDAKPELSRVILSEIFRVDRPWREAMDIAKTTLFEQFAEIYAAIGPNPIAAGNSSQLIGAVIVGATLVAGIDHQLYHPEVPAEEVADALVRVWAKP